MILAALPIYPLGSLLAALAVVAVELLRFRTGVFRERA